MRDFKPSKAVKRGHFLATSGKAGCKVSKDKAISFIRQKTGHNFHKLRIRLIRLDAVQARTGDREKFKTKSSKLKVDPTHCVTAP